MNDEWQIQDLPVHSWKVLTEPNPVTGEIKQITAMMGRTTEAIFKTRSNQLRNALIDLGWKPPEHEGEPDSVLPEYYRERWLSEALECKFMNMPITELPLKDLWCIVAFLIDREISRNKPKRTERYVHPVKEN